MSLINGYSDDNKQTQTGLQKQYNYEAKFFVVKDTLCSVYRVTRHATKQYSYVGMTESAARNCAAAKTAQYTKTHKGWKLTYSDQGGLNVAAENYTACGAQAQAVHDQGGMWHTQINVNEQDEVWTTTLPAQLSSLFDETGDYDE